MPLLRTKPPFSNTTRSRPFGILRQTNKSGELQFLKGFSVTNEQSKEFFCRRLATCCSQKLTLHTACIRFTSADCMFVNSVENYTTTPENRCDSILIRNTGGSSFYRGRPRQVVSSFSKSIPRFLLISLEVKICAFSSLILNSSITMLMAISVELTSVSVLFTNLSQKLVWLEITIAWLQL